jgi:hypothetical protein
MGYLLDEVVYLHPAVQTSYEQWDLTRNDMINEPWLVNSGHQTWLESHPKNTSGFPIARFVYWRVTEEHRFIPH